jgi:hypothetical protein
VRGLGCSKYQDYERERIRLAFPTLSIKASLHPCISVIGGTAEYKSYDARGQGEVTELWPGLSKEAVRERQINAEAPLAVVMGVVFPLRVRSAVPVSRPKRDRREIRAIRGRGCIPFAALLFVHFVSFKI